MDSVPSTLQWLKRAQACEQSVMTEIKKGSSVSIVSLLEHIIEHGYCLKASDIHIDPTKTGLKVQFRIDGSLQSVYTLSLQTHTELIARLKILCGLRTDEHQAAQDGRFSMTFGSAEAIDIRASIMPLYYGENVVLRLLVGDSKRNSLVSLGFSAANQTKITNALKKPYGMILATGPTGSGKTTTLYTLISEKNNDKTSIVTIEDPIEYAIEGVNQIQVNSKTGLTFATGLRSMLRQDPNTIMVGEIRDRETAGLAINIALTGHTVFSTLHTNDAATTLPRLLDMKIEPYLIASTVNVAIGQRLVRVLCNECKVKKTLTDLEIKTLEPIVGSSPLLLNRFVYTSVGCQSCNKTGYQGRIGIHEVLVVTEAVREAILLRYSASLLRLVAIKEGMVPLIEDGFDKVLNGITTIEEVLKINYE